jgi:hypothetical protein
MSRTPTREALKALIKTGLPGDNVEISSRPAGDAHPCLLPAGDHPMDLKLGGRSALITGASKGIGLAAAWAFAGEGVHLHLDVCNSDALAAAKTAIEATHPVSVGVHAFNLGQTEAMRALGEAAGEVDILIHDAGDILAGSLDSVVDGIRVVGVNPGPVAIDRMVKLMKRRALKI